MARIQGSKLFQLVLLAAVAVAAHAQTPAVAQGGVLNAANGIFPVTPGSLVSIYGTDLAGGLAQADTIPLSNSLNQVSVTLNGIPAPLLFVSQGQVNAQVPWNVLQSGTSGTVSIVVMNHGQPSSSQAVPIGPFSPGIFAIGNIAVAQNVVDASVAAPAGAIPGVETHPATINDPYGLAILCTGLGAVDSAIANGANSSDLLRRTTTTPTVLVGGQPVKVLFSGLSPQFVGVNQINVTLPPGTPTGDAVPLQISIGGIVTTNTITIAVQPQQ
jgi:uncharacterized protein (TIGR03437 family)